MCGSQVGIQLNVWFLGWDSVECVVLWWGFRSMCGSQVGIQFNVWFSGGDGV
jgi:hypothetical protein